MKSILAIAVSCTILGACGGGSGSSSSAYPSVSDYDYVQLDAENANDSVSASFQGVGGAGGAEVELAEDAGSASSVVLMAQKYASEYMRSSSIQSKAATQSEQVDCDQSGSVKLQVQGDLSNAGDWLQITYNNCVDNDSTISGSQRIDVYANSLNEMDLKATFSKLSIVESSETATLDGDLRLAWLKNGTMQTNTMSSSRLNMVSSVSGNTVISDLNLESISDSGSDTSTLEMAYDLASDELDGRLTFSTPELMQYQGAESNPSTGIFKVVGAGGSSITLNANTGDAATVMFTLFNGSSTTSEEVNWASIEGSDLSVIADF